MIALNSPIKPNLQKLNRILSKINDNGWYTNFGPVQSEFKDRLEDYLGVRHLLLTNNGTSALQVAARAIGSESLISTPFSFVATVSAFKWQNDTIAFSDIDRRSLNLCPNSIREIFQNKTGYDSVIGTHVYGNPCDVHSFEKLRDKYQFKLIYDASHAFGVKVGDSSVLNYGDASTLSFHATKVFHTIEGGAVVFRDESSYERAEEIINFGIKRGKGILNVGINAKMNEYQAAVGLVNLDEIDSVLSLREELFQEYCRALKDFVELPTWHSDATVNGAYMPILLNDSKQLCKVMDSLQENGIQSRNYFTPSLNKVFDECHNFGSNVSENASSRVLCLPMHAYLNMKDITKVVNVVKRAIND